MVLRCLWYSSLTVRYHTCRRKIPNFGSFCLLLQWNTLNGTVNILNENSTLLKINRIYNANKKTWHRFSTSNRKPVNILNIWDTTDSDLNYLHYKAAIQPNFLHLSLSVSQISRGEIIRSALSLIHFVVNVVRAFLDDKRNGESWPYIVPNPRGIS